MKSVKDAANMELNQGSITARTVLASVFTEWMFFSFRPQKAAPATPKSIAASSFKFVLIPSPPPADLKSISCSMPRCNVLQHRTLPARCLNSSGSVQAETVPSPYSPHALPPPPIQSRFPSKGDAVMGFLTNFHLHCQCLICYLLPLSPPLCGFHNTVAARLKQRSPDWSITNLHSQQSVTDSMPTKPLAIHY